MRSHRVFIVHANLTAVSFDTENPILADLAVPLSRAIGAVIVEEAVQAGAIHENAVGINYS